MIDQIIIAATGVTALYLTQSKHAHRRRWACLFGMAAQPAWFYATSSAGQWGIFFLNFLYAGAWAKGIWHHWIQPWREHRREMRIAEGLEVLRRK